MDTFMLREFHLKKLFKKTTLIIYYFTRLCIVSSRLSSINLGEAHWFQMGSWVCLQLVGGVDWGLDDLVTLAWLTWLCSMWSLILHQVTLGLLSRLRQRWGEQDLLRSKFRISTFISSAFSWSKQISRPAQTQGVGKWTIALWRLKSQSTRSMDIEGVENWGCFAADLP